MQVAAAANKPTTPHVKPQTTNTAEAQNARNNNLERIQNVMVTPPESGSANEAAVVSSTLPNGPQAAAGSLHRMMKDVSIEDKSAATSSVDNLGGKKDNSDTKSVTSRTTLTIDEKESLRPDDSASMQGVQDDEIVSPLDTAQAGLRIDATSDARAFRDQLYEIDKHGAKRMQLAQRPISSGSLPQHQRQNVVAFPNQPIPAIPAPIVAPAHIQSEGPPPGLSVPPDNKLIEALNSPKDRLFVLKIEQDFIDFIKNSRELELQLPSTNTFYRLLSHKLAEYYFLGHIYEDSLKAVRIRKLPHTRLAPALITCEPKSEATTPPPTGSMKIMRRGPEIPGVTSLDNSRPQSSSEYENGNRSGGEDDQRRNQDKQNPTREEREKKYAEVRARIFDGFEEGKIESVDVANGQSKEMSRSSSNSGPKKTKRGKRPKDDSFEARSSYTSINGQAVHNSGFLPASQGDPMYYNGYPPYANFQPMPAFSPAQPHFQLPQQDYSNTPTWPGSPPNFGHYYGGQQNVTGYGQYAPSQLDPPNAYYSSPNMAAQSTPRAHQAGLAGYFQPYPPQTDGGAWAHPAYQMQYGQPACVPDGSQTAFMVPYGFDPHMQHAQGMSMYAGQSFNPQSQAFIPGAHFGHAQNWQQQPQTPNAYPSPNFQQVSPGRNGTSPNNRLKAANVQNQQTPTSSIAKWAAPSSLPPKPPPTHSALSFQMPRHMEQGQPLPSKPLGASGRT